MKIIIVALLLRPSLGLALSEYNQWLGWLRVRVKQIKVSSKGHLAAKMPEFRLTLSCLFLVIQTMVEHCQRLTLRLKLRAESRRSPCRSVVWRTVS